MTKPKKIRIKATAECASFEISVSAQVSSDTLAREEMDDVRRKLKHSLTTSIAKLPFAHVYPFEVNVQ